MDELKTIDDIIVDTTVPESISEEDELMRLAKFSDKYLPVFVKLRDLIEYEKELKEKIDKTKEELGTMMDRYDVKSVSNSIIRITRVSSSSSTSLDTGRLKKEDPELFEKIFKQYNKTVNKKAYTKIET